MSSVTPEAIAVALGRTAPDSNSTEYAQWLMWITDAEMLIETRRLEVDDTLAIDAVKLNYVVREAVVAQARRPDDATQVTVSVDDGSMSRTYQRSRGRVTILDEWWSLLGLTGSGRGRAFEIDTLPVTAGVYGVDYVWTSTTETGPVL